MTIEEKAEAYDEALKRARDVYTYYCDDREQLRKIESIFPELKESEDERMRAMAIKAVHAPEAQSCIKSWGINPDDVIAWLEKQTNIIPNECVFRPLAGTDIKLAAKQAIEQQGVLAKEIVLAFNGAYIPVKGKAMDIVVNEYESWLEKQVEQKPAYKSQVEGYLTKKNETTEKLIALAECLEMDGDCLFNGLSGNDYGKFLRELAKKIEQNPADKAEPKFHEGDWVVQGNIVAQILDVQEQYYVGLDTEGNDFTSSKFLSDDKMHLWTIQDAKDGDVLDANGAPFIYKRHDKDYVYCYCGVNLGGEFTAANGNNIWNNNNKVYPATKEQRDTLFTKMKEAGYEWNAELKELRKFPTPADVGFAELGKAWEEEADIEEVNGEDYGIDGLYHAQRILEKTLGEVDGYQSDDGILDHKAAITAVKKIYEHKSAWSEEDEKNLQGIIDEIQANKSSAPSYDINVYDRYLSWLKSLRPQRQWKPSEEQLKFLQHYADQNNYDGTVLTSLLDGLKKL